MKKLLLLFVLMIILSSCYVQTSVVPPVPTYYEFGYYMYPYNSYYIYPKPLRIYRAPHIAKLRR
jgi:hypothetical protein